MRTAIDSRAEDLRSLRIPEHPTVGRAHDDAIFHNLQRIDRGVPHDDAIAIDVALAGVDGVQDELGGNERACAVVQDDVIVLVGDVLEAGERRLLTRRTRGRDHNGRNERERVDCAVEIFLLAVLGAHDDDEPHVAHGVERLCRPGENGLPGDFDELLAAFATETLARTARQDDGGRLRLGVDNALQAAHRFRERIEVEVIEHRVRYIEHGGRVDGVDRFRHESPSLVRRVAEMRTRARRRQSDASFACYFTASSERTETFRITS